MTTTPRGALLITGCTSDAGKSLVTAGLCRVLYRRGISVAPFKAQNMSNNSVVCPDGGEIGRAQAMQAEACGLLPSPRFNPILLKPSADHTSQLVVRGIAENAQVSARNYIEHRTRLRGIVAAELASLREEFDVVLCEGAGSPAEINLRATDLSNLGLAEAADLATVLVGDIDRGGVLAHFYGTQQILEPADQARIAGFIVNKFRGDVSLLEPGLADLEQRTGVPTLGVLPYLTQMWLDAEDSLGATSGRAIGPGAAPYGSESLTVAAIRFPRVSNFTDVEALACEPGVHVRWVDTPGELAGADLIVLPGSKSTVADLEWMRSHGLAEAISTRVRAGTPVLGICGGFQMLSRSIIDPVESGSTHPVEGLRIFSCDIEFHQDKTLADHGWSDRQRGLSATGLVGYEIHHGRVVRASDPTWITGEGAVLPGRWGTHWHGVLDDDATRREFLGQVARFAGKDGFVPAPDTQLKALRTAQLDRIADACEEYLDLDRLFSFLR